MGSSGVPQHILPVQHYVILTVVEMARLLVSGLGFKNNNLSQKSQRGQASLCANGFVYLRHQDTSPMRSSNVMHLIRPSTIHARYLKSSVVQLAATCMKMMSLSGWLAANALLLARALREGAYSLHTVTTIATARKSTTFHFTPQTANRHELQHGT